MVRIVTDSTSDISLEEAKRIGVEIVPLKVIFGEEVFKDGVDIKSTEFYKKLAESEKLPTTSQPSPQEFLPIFKDAAEKGDSVVVMLISGALSGTVQSAEIAKELAEYGDIHIIDSLCTISSLNLLVKVAIKLRDEGKTGAEIAEEILDIIPRVTLYAVVDTLDYFYKGGRLSRAAKIAGSLLSFKPLITIDEHGELKVVGKGRGLKNAMNMIVDLVNETPVDTDLPVHFGYTAALDTCNTLREVLKEKCGIEANAVAEIGSVVGTHVGPGACAISYVAKK